MTHRFNGSSTQRDSAITIGEEYVPELHQMSTTASNIVVSKSESCPRAGIIRTNGVTMPRRVDPRDYGDTFAWTATLAFDVTAAKYTYAGPGDTSSRPLSVCD